jgi:predicted ATP-grasp superfamily ATP-dependent carboligase
MTVRELPQDRKLTSRQIALVVNQLVRALNVAGTGSATLITSLDEEQAAVNKDIRTELRVIGFMLNEAFNLKVDMEELRQQFEED